MLSPLQSLLSARSNAAIGCNGLDCHGRYGPCKDFAHPPALSARGSVPTTRQVCVSQNQGVILTTKLEDVQNELQKQGGPASEVGGLMS